MIPSKMVAPQVKQTAAPSSFQEYVKTLAKWEQDMLQRLLNSPNNADLKFKYLTADRTQELIDKVEHNPSLKQETSTKMEKEKTEETKELKETPEKQVKGKKKISQRSNNHTGFKIRY